MSTTKETRSKLIETTAGTVRVMFHGGGLATVDTWETGRIDESTFDKRRASGVVTVNRVEYSGRIDLRDAGGEYSTDGRYFGMTRASWRQDRDDRPSDSARRKLREMAESAVRRALRVSPGLAAAGDTFAADSARESLEREQEELRTKLAEVAGKLAELDA